MSQSCCRTHRCIDPVDRDGLACGRHARLTHPCPTCTQWKRQKWDYCPQCRGLGWVSAGQLQDVGARKPDYERGAAGKEAEEAADVGDQAGDEEEEEFSSTCPDCGEYHGTRRCSLLPVITYDYPPPASFPYLVDVPLGRVEIMVWGGLREEGRLETVTVESSDGRLARVRFLSGVQTMEAADLATRIAEVRTIPHQKARERNRARKGGGG